MVGIVCQKGKRPEAKKGVLLPENDCSRQGNKALNWDRRAKRWIGEGGKEETGKILQLVTIGFTYNYRGCKVAPLSLALSGSRMATAEGWLGVSPQIRGLIWLDLIWLYTVNMKKTNEIRSASQQKVVYARPNWCKITEQTPHVREILLPTKACLTAATSQNFDSMEKGKQKNGLLWHFL